MGPHIIFLSIIITVVLGANIDIKSKYQVVKEGDRVEILCSTNGALDYCRIEVPGEGQLSLSENKPLYKGIIKYFGRGLAQGECGAVILKTSQKHNGDIRCTFTATAESKESSANMTLVVAKAPSRPSLSISKTEYGSYIYREGDTLIATCTVQNGRPPANISWYLGEQRIHEGTEALEVKAADDLFNVEQKLQRKVQASDNGKDLRCQAEHPLLQDRDSSTSQKIQVHFAPKASGPIEYFGLVEGEDGRVAARVSAHPRPSFTWHVGNTPLYEAEDNARFKVEKAKEVPPGSGNWESVLIIKSLTKEDVEKVYTLTAANKQGERKFTVTLSTSPEPQGMDVGAGTIIAVVAAGLIIITITAMLLFARAKGRWCFAGGQGGRIAGESSDTESADQTEPKSKLVFTSVFKKKGDKVGADQEQVKDVTVNDEKVYDTAEGCEEDEDKPKGEGVVYAELDFAVNPGNQPRPASDKTEYAEIILAGKQ